MISIFTCSFPWPVYARDAIKKQSTHMATSLSQILCISTGIKRRHSVLSKTMSFFFLDQIKKLCLYPTHLPLNPS